ncbi:Polygalacturonase [Musa troglodytarum]|uniref:Polygalacturonase n=1 Tax=Musa troglodytarum TaxID=320322 RepID=A0A9E7KLD6_9LILI|nr:Polygalacturonase [Musa troglodytarum]
MLKQASGAALIRVQHVSFYYSRIETEFDTNQNLKGDTLIADSFSLLKAKWKHDQEKRTTQGHAKGFIRDWIIDFVTAG